MKSINLIGLMALCIIQPLFANDVATDEALKIGVKSKLLQNSPASVLNIDISAKNGVISLSGTVDSDQQASTLIEWTQSTPGVKEVDIHALKVKNSQQPATDTVITAKVKGLFSQENSSLSTVNVETKEGIVYLTGKAENKSQAEQANAIAHKVAGIKGVETKIEYNK